MDNVLIIPIIVPLFFGVAIMTICRSLWSLRLYSILAFVLNIAVAFVLVARTAQGEILVLRLGNWPAPFGIVMAADLLSSLMILTTTFLALIVTIYAQRGLESRRERRFFHPLTQFLVMGVNMSFLTNDMFNMFVSFEVMLIASYGLLSLGAGRRQMKPVFLYLCLNILAGMLFLVAAGYTYGMLGTLNFADLAHRVQQLPPDDLRRLYPIVFLLLLVFGSKAAMFPVFFWLPHGYSVVATPVVALFAAMLTKVGVYAMIRVLDGVFLPVFAPMQPLVLTLAGLTMVLGVVGAVAQTSIKRILSFHIVSQIGYMIMGLALLTPASIAAAVFFMIHNMLVKTGLLLVGGMVEMRRGTDELDRLGGLWRSEPLLGVTFFVLAMALAGLPPLTGFWGKLMLIEAGFEVGAYAIIAVSIGVSILTAFSMLKIWLYAFWRAEPQPAPAGDGASSYGTVGPPGSRQWIATLALAGTAVVLSILAEPLIAATYRAGTELLDHDRYYRRIVMHDGRDPADDAHDPWRTRPLVDPARVLPPEAPLLPRPLSLRPSEAPTSPELRRARVPPTASRAGAAMLAEEDVAP